MIRPQQTQEPSPAPKFPNCSYKYTCEVKRVQPETIRTSYSKTPVPQIMKKVVTSRPVVLTRFVGSGLSWHCLLIRLKGAVDDVAIVRFCVRNAGFLVSYQKIELILKGVLMDDLYQNSSLSQLDEPDPKEKTMDLFTKDLDYMEKIKELQGYLDTVKKIAKPGCSQEVLNVALSSMSSLVNFLSSRSKTLSSL